MTWMQRLQSAVKRGRFTSQDIRLAESWSQCAVGEQPRRITGIDPKDEYSEPADVDLENLGVDFADHIRESRVTDAIDTYYAIRNRVKEMKG